jgi:glycosyltransferase involved in cell wall biosynthesis
MRIAFVVPRAWPSTGGVQTLARELGRELAQRHEVTVLALSVGDEPPTRTWDTIGSPAAFDAFRDGDVEIVPLRLPRARLAPVSLLAAPGARRYAYGRLREPAARYYERVVAPVIARAAAGADVIHVFSPGFLARAAVRAAHDIGARSFVLASLHQGQWGDDPVSARAYRNADGVFAQLDVEAKLYRALGVDDDRITISGACAAPVDAAPMETSHPLILFLGVRRAYKGIDVFLDAARIVRGRRPDVTFAVAGPGDPIEQEGVLDLGTLDTADRGRWLAAADLVCLPSAAESFGLVVLEAWSAGTPVVVSDIPSLRELVDGAGVIAARTGEAFAEAIVDALSKPELAAAGRDRLRSRYTPAAVTARVEAAYEH